MFTSGALWLPPMTDGSYSPPDPPSDGQGVLDGQGGRWWGVPGIGYLVHGENRPRMLSIHNSTRTLVENMYFQNSPYWTFYCNVCEDLEVRFSKISARRTELEFHDLVDITAFNTDGFDVTGARIWIHDVEVRKEAVLVIQ